MGLDEELWDILEDGVGDLDLDEEGVVVDRKKHTPAPKKMYKKHHKIRGSTTKAMFASLCANYMKVVRRLEKLKHLCLFISMSYSR